VRASQLSGGEAALVFARQLPAPDQRAWAQVESLRNAAEAAAQRAQQQAVKSKGPQQLYLLAGQAQRGKSTQINGKSYSATELYESIVENFPQSDYAVKATDQLNAMARSNQQSNAARDAAAASERAAAAQRDADRNSSNRAACFSQVNSCQANCRASSMSYSSIQYCVSSCQRTCN